jgi:putative zinc finger/helix-turn-helix YgiT family protein
MLCFKCKSEEFETREIKVHQEFRGEHFDVVTPVSVCKECGWQTLGAGQVDELRKQTVEEYRQQHHLLTSTEIILRRGIRGMSQQDFAKFIGVGVASIKRWERGFVQEPVYDRLIRQKCDSTPFPCHFNVDWVPEGLFATFEQLSITTRIVAAWASYASPQEIVWSNINRVTTSDAQLSAASKEWRKRHTKSCDTDFISCH